MKRSTIIIVSLIIFFASNFRTVAAAPKVTVATPLGSVQLAQAAIAPTTVPTQPAATTPEPTLPPAKPTSAPTAAPTVVPTTTLPSPTAAPKPTPIIPVIVTPTPSNQKEKETQETVSEITSQIDDTPTPTPSPNPVQVLQQIVPEDKTPPDKPSQPIQQIFGPSAAMFLRSLSPNYYAINSLSLSESVGLFTISLLLIGFGAFLLYRTQREELLIFLDRFLTRYILPSWIRQKEFFFTLFERGYSH